MEKVKVQLKNRSPERIYLLTGTEMYLISSMKKHFINLIKEKNLNMEVYTHNPPVGKSLVASCFQMPIFEEFRLLILDRCLKKDDYFVDHIGNLPESTVVVVIEPEIDKRGRLYKAIKKHGYICECNPCSPERLQAWTVKALKNAGKEINQSAYQHLLEIVGTDMNNLAGEIRKLNTVKESVITSEIIDNICFPIVENKIFEMINLALAGNKEKAMHEYADLVTLKESSYKILALINRQISILLQIKESLSKSDSDLAKQLGIPPFAVRKNRNCTKTSDELKALLERGVNLEYSIKTGKIKDDIAVAVMLAAC